MSIAALSQSRPQARPHVRSWIGICSLFTAPVFAGLAFVLTWNIRGDAAKLGWGHFALESILVVTLVMLAIFLLMTLWQWSWAISLIRDSLKADPQGGYLLLSVLLFTTALVSLLTVSIIHPMNRAYSASAFMLAWLPAALAALGSAVAMSRARANAFLWFGYLLFAPLAVVSVDTLMQQNLCGSTGGTAFNVFFLTQMQAPWVMVGFAMVVATMIVAAVKAWRSGAVDSWLLLRAASVGLPLSAFALLALTAWTSYSALGGCDGHHLRAFHHLFGSFYI